MPQGAGVRLYAKGVFSGYLGGKKNTYHKTALIHIQGVKDTESAEFYLGKKIAYVYKAKTLKAGSKFRVIWGKVRRTHGTSGVVRASFSRNLPPQAMGAQVRVMLYPSSI